MCATRCMRQPMRVSCLAVQAIWFIYRNTSASRLMKTAIQMSMAPLGCPVRRDVRLQLKKGNQIISIAGNEALVLGDQSDPGRPLGNSKEEDRFRVNGKFDGCWSRVQPFDYCYRSLGSLPIRPMRTSQGASGTQHMATARLDRLSFSRIRWT